MRSALGKRLGQSWPDGPLQPPLPQNDVHIWIAEQSEQPSELHAALSVLSEQERHRAGTAASPAFRQSYIATRSMLRGLLGRYLQIGPEEVTMDTGAHGRPRLAAIHAVDLRFSVSHAAGLSVVALACGRNVGIDIEAIDRRPFRLDRVRRIFSTTEIALLDRLPHSERQQAFLRGWVRKESYTKARGAGIQYGLRNFSVALAEAGSSNLLTEDRADVAATGRWSIQEIQLPGPFVGALAIHERNPAVRQWRFAG